MSSCRDNHIIPSIIPAGITGLTLFRDIAINKPFKSVIWEFVDEIKDQKEMDGIEKWIVD